MLAIMGCAADERQPQGAPASPPPRPITIAIESDPGAVDPLHAVEASALRLSVLLHEGLVVLDDSLRVKPGVARQWEVSKKTIRFQLHEDARFSDGRPLTTEDVRFTLERLLDPLVETPLSRGLAKLEGAAKFRAGKVDSVRGIAVVDSATVELRFDTLFGPVLELLADPQAAIVPAGLGGSESIPGLGPWTVRRHDPGQGFVLAPRPGYHGGAPLAPELALRVLPDHWEQRAAFDRGELEVIELPSFEEMPLRDGTYRTLMATATTVRAVAVNCRKYPFDAWRVRQALNYGVDVENVLRGLRGHSAERAAGALAPAFFDADASREAYRYDPDWALELLTAAGFPRGFHMEVWYVRDAERRRLVDALRLGLRRVGVELRPVECEADEFDQAIADGTADAVLTEFTPPYLSAEALLHHAFHSSNFGLAGNIAFYESRRVDRILAQMAAAADPAKRASLAATLENRLREAAPWLVLWHPRRLWVTAPDVAGFVAAPDDRLQRYLTIHRVAEADTLLSAGDVR